MSIGEFTVCLSANTGEFKEGLDNTSGTIFDIEQRRNCRAFNRYLAEMELMKNSKNVFTPNIKENMNFFRHTKEHDKGYWLNV